MANVLAVDDNEALRQLLQSALDRDGHCVKTLACGAELSDAALRWADCILLDVMMPEEDGFSICRRIRPVIDCPILFLTACAAEADVLTGFSVGGDDYITKPFHIAELRARVNAHIRRQQRAPHHRLARGELLFDLSARTLSCRGQPISLTRSEYALCEYLALHPGQPFSKEHIYTTIFGYDGSADSSAITEHVKNIRAKLRVFSLNPIQTIWGVGYSWHNP